MGWRDLLQKEGEQLVLPWIGGRILRQNEQTWSIDGRLPQEFGWYTFKLDGRKVRLGGAADPNPDALQHLVRGYLVGDRLVPDDVRVDPEPKKIVSFSKPVHLLEPGLDRFVRVIAGSFFEDGPLIFQVQEMPLGPEDEVLTAFLDQVSSLEKVRGVSPALDAAFRMETWQRVEAERRRIELERKRREEEARLLREEKRQELLSKLGDSKARRELAPIDFGEAARSALAVSGAVYLDHRKSNRQGEIVVRFRLANRRFECVCEERTLCIIDAGICLTDHDTGEKHDGYLTLESLPSVVQEAIDEGKLVVFRHVD